MEPVRRWAQNLARAEPGGTARIDLWARQEYAAGRGIRMTDLNVALRALVDAGELTRCPDGPERGAGVVYIVAAVTAMVAEAEPAPRAA